MSTPSPRPIDPPVAPAPPLAPRRVWPRIPRAAWILGAIVLLAVLYRWWQAPAGDGTVEYITAPVDRGAIEQTVVATGTVNPVKTVQVGTYVSGPILAIDVDYNSRVAKGQRVAKIDPAPFTVKVRQAEANLATARARAEKSRADLDLKRLLLERNRTLLGQRIVSQNDLDTAKSNAEQAVAQLSLEEASVMQAQASLD